MKQKFLVLMWAVFTLMLAGCQEKKTSSSSNNSNPYAANCTGQAYWTTPGCAGYCQYQPTAYGCPGATTGGTATGGTTTGGTTTGGTTGTSTGGTTGVNCTYPPISNTCPNYCLVSPGAYGCLANGTNCNANPAAAGCPGSSTTVSPNWGVLYPGGEPQGTCSDPYLPEGQTTAFNTRKGTITLAGLKTGSIVYSPFAPDTPNLLNTSPMLKSVSQAKVFYMTDSILKVRFKVKPQPDSRQTTTMCYGRQMPGTMMSGYTKLQYRVNVYGVGAGNAVTYLGTKGPFTTGVNSCSQGLDLSEYINQSPNQTGIVVTVEQVKANQDCWDNYTTSGFTTCNAYKNVRSFDCWAMDIEVAADGTKTFD
jgi:hypothetical protein